MINTNDATKLLPSPKSLPKKRTNCKVKGCTRQIQSNFSGHCCRCYKDKFPNRYAKIRAAIKKKSPSNDDGINHKKKKQKKNSASNELHQSKHPFKTLQQPDNFDPLNALRLNENRTTNSINVMPNERDGTINELTIRNTFENGENVYCTARNEFSPHMTTNSRSDILHLQNTVSSLEQKVTAMTFKINTLENGLNQMSGQLTETTTFVERWFTIDTHSFNSDELRTSDEYEKEQHSQINFNSYDINGSNDTSHSGKNIKIFHIGKCTKINLTSSKIKTKRLSRMITPQITTITQLEVHLIRIMTNSPMRLLHKKYILTLTNLDHFTTIPIMKNMNISPQELVFGVRGNVRWITVKGVSILQ